MSSYRNAMLPMRFQFRLRTLFVLITVVAAATAAIVHVRHVQERIQFHEARLALYQQREASLTAALRRSRQRAAEVEEKRIADAISRGYLLHRNSPSSEGEDLADLVETPQTAELSSRAELWRENRARQEQIVTQFRQSLWRPWRKVIDDVPEEEREQPSSQILNVPPRMGAAGVTPPPLPPPGLPDSPDEFIILPVDKARPRKIPWQPVQCPHVPPRSRPAAPGVQSMLA